MTHPVDHPSGATGPEVVKTPKKAAASGWIGSALEYYDFFIYAQAAALVFPEIFFPKGNPTVAIVASLATFGVGYLARPVGAFFMGHYGDTHGRKNALVLCMLMMGIATFATAFLPTYGQIGIWAPVLLVMLRLIQGFAVSGEIAGASSMILEHSPDGKRGYYCSFTMQGNQAGQIVAAGVFIPLSMLLPREEFLSWGWRIPFLLSVAVMIAGYVIRRKVDESPVFVQEAQGGKVPQAPIVQVFREHKAALLRVAGMAFMNGVAVTTTVFGAAYATQSGYGVDMRASTFLWIPVLANIAAICVIPFFGKASDKYGRRRIFVFGALTSGSLMFAYLYFISQGNAPMTVLTSIVMWGVLYQGYNAVFPSFFLEQFPTRNRVTAFAIATNVGFAVTGFIPALHAVIAPPGSSHIPLTVGGVTFGLTVLAACAAWASRETNRTPTHLLGEKPTGEDVGRFLAPAAAGVDQNGSIR
ncbi:MFS transporter [Rhodococcus koreensis]